MFKLRTNVYLLIFFLLYAALYSQSTGRKIIPKSNYTVELLSRPAGARVYVNQELKGKTPLILKVPNGKYELRLERKPFQPINSRFRAHLMKKQRLFYAFNKTAKRVPKTFSYSFIRLIGGTEALTLNYPSGLIVSGNKLIICDSQQKRLVVAGTDGKFINAITFSGDKSFNFPTDICRTATGYAVSDLRKNRLVYLSKDLSFIKFSSGKNDILLPSGVDFRKGTLAVCDSGNNQLRVWQAEQSSKAIGKAAGLLEPMDVAITAKGDYVIADWGNSRLVVLSAAQTIKQIVSLDYMPGHVMVDEFDNVYVCDTDHNKIQVYNAKLTFEKSIAITQGNGPYGITGAQGYLYISLRNSHQVLVLKERD